MRKLFALITTGLAIAFAGQAASAGGYGSSGYGSSGYGSSGYGSSGYSTYAGYGSSGYSSYGSSGYSTASYGSSGYRSAYTTTYGSSGYSTAGYGSSGYGSSGYSSYSYGSSGYSTASYGSSGYSTASYGSSGYSTARYRTGPVRRLLSHIASHHRAGYGSSGYSASYGSSGYSTYGYGSSGYSSYSSYGSSGYSTGYGSSGYSTYSGYGSSGSSTYVAPTTYGSSGSSYYYSASATSSSSNTVVASGRASTEPRIALASATASKMVTSSVNDYRQDEIQLTVRVPETAKVFVNGNSTTSQGTIRQFVSRSLDPSLEYRFEIRVEDVVDGKPATESKTIVLSPGKGEVVEFDLSAPNSEVETTLTLNVPADATVLLAGNKTKTAGDIRTYRTKELKSGDVWDNYTIQVTKNGVTREKTIRLIAGDDIELSFDFDTTNDDLLAIR